MQQEKKMDGSFWKALHCEKGYEQVQPKLANFSAVTEKLAQLQEEAALSAEQLRSCEAASDIARTEVSAVIGWEHF